MYVKIWHVKSFDKYVKHCSVYSRSEPPVLEFAVLYLNLNLFTMSRFTCHWWINFPSWRSLLQDGKLIHYNPKSWQIESLRIK